MTGFIYPVVVSWTWGGGWLSKQGFFDFAGSGVVSLLGGSSGLIGAYIIGPRHGKEKNAQTRKDVFLDDEFVELEKKSASPDRLKLWIRDRENQPFKPNSIPFMVMGTLILWVAWLFFNGGSAYTMFGPRHQSVPKIIMNTLISGGVAGLISTFFKPYVMQTYKSSWYDVGALCNGILGGLVAVTAACNNVQPWAALVIGIIAAFVYTLGCKLLTILDIDDPIEASAVHCFCGMWGLLAVGFFDKQQGLFSGAEDGKWRFFAWQVIGLIVIFFWSSIISALYFIAMAKFQLLRVSLLDEIVGLDISEMGLEKPTIFNDILAITSNPNLMIVSDVRIEQEIELSKK